MTGGNQDQKEANLLDNHISFYELNEEGLRQFGVIKKKQKLTILKWSLLGTAFGFYTSLVIEFTLKNMNPVKKDLLKTFGLFVSVSLFTLQGYQTSITEYKKKKQELCENYGMKVV